MTHASIPPEARAELGLSDNLIRLSPGCENAEDLVEDLLEGLSNLERAREGGKRVQKEERKEVRKEVREKDQKVVTARA